MHNEPWQVYSNNGASLSGHSADKGEINKNPSLIVGASHVWIWRENNGTTELLLQKRSGSVKSWPGYYDISTAGHIDANESPIETAVREAEEEVGLGINADDLYFVFSLRASIRDTEFDWVYLYKLTNDAQFRFEDGEVESLEWVTLEEFQERISDTSKNKIVPHGDPYFALLLMNLRRII